MQRLHKVSSQEYMALVNITHCENTTVQYLCITSLTARLWKVGHDS